MSELPQRSIKELPKVPGISGNAVCQVSLEVCPDKFIRVKLRRVSGEVKGMESGTTSKEFFDKFGPVERASVPEKNDGPSDLATKVPKKLSDLFGPDISCIKARVKSKPPSLGRDCNSGDGRDLCPTSSDNEGWSLSSDRPSSLDVWDKRESALIQEGQAGSKPNGLFLYAAKRGASSNEFFPRVFAWLSWLVSDSSSQGVASDSKDSRRSSAPRIVCGLPARYVSMSKDLSNNQLPEDLSLRRAPEFSSDAPISAEAVRYSESVSVPSSPSSGSLGASAPRSLKKRLVLGLLSDRYGLVSTSERPSAGASPAFGGCHEVS